MKTSKNPQTPTIDSAPESKPVRQPDPTPNPPPSTPPTPTSTATTTAPASPNRGGRPKKLTPAVRDVLFQQLARGLNYTQACAPAPTGFRWTNSPNNLPMPATHPTKLGKICRIFRRHQFQPPVPSEMPFCRTHSNLVNCASTFGDTRPSVRALHRPVDWFFAKKHAKHPNKPTKLGKNCPPCHGREQNRKTERPGE